MLPRSYKDEKINANVSSFVSHAGLGCKEFKKDIVDHTTLLDSKSPHHA